MESAERIGVINWNIFNIVGGIILLLGCTQPTMPHLMTVICAAFGGASVTLGIIGLRLDESEVDDTDEP